MPIAEVPTLMFQPKMLEIALPCIWLPMMDMWRHHLIDHATSCHSMNCPVSWCDGRALADCRYCRLLGFCSKLALMRMPNALEAGPHFSSLFFQQRPFSIFSSTPTLPILSNSVYCRSFRVANCAGTAKDIVSQRHRCLPHIEATG